MKKLVLLLAVIASVSFFSCNKGDGSNSASDTTDTTTAQVDSNAQVADSDSANVQAPVETVTKDSSEVKA